MSNLCGEENHCALAMRDVGGEENKRNSCPPTVSPLGEVTGEATEIVDQVQADHKKYVDADYQRLVDALYAPESRCTKLWFDNVFYRAPTRELMSPMAF